MNFNMIWQTTLIFIIGNFLLRIGGRKAIAQMTVTQATVMIGFGTVLVSPLVNKSITETFLVLLILVILMIISEYLEEKFDFLETLFTGKAIIIIENGKINMENLKKLRMTVDKLEIRLREASISSIEDVMYATIETNGKLGYKLKPEKEYATKGDIDLIMTELQKIKDNLNITSNKKEKFTKSSGKNFKEIKNKTFEGDRKEF